MRQYISPRHVIAALLAIAVWGAGELFLRHLATGSACPVWFGIPVCGMIWIFALLAFVVHMRTQQKKRLMLCILPPLLIAIYASVVQTRGLAHCPSTANDVPMCYVSLGIFGLTVLVVCCYDTRSW